MGREPMDVQFTFLSVLKSNSDGVKFNRLEMTNVGNGMTKIANKNAENIITIAYKIVQYFFAPLPSVHHTKTVAKVHIPFIETFFSKSIVFQRRHAIN